MAKLLAGQVLGGGLAVLALMSAAGGTARAAELRTRIPKLPMPISGEVFGLVDDAANLSETIRRVESDYANGTLSDKDRVAEHARNVGKVVGKVGGAVVGAPAGGMVGTFVAGPVGTEVGRIAGAGVGAVIGERAVEAVVERSQETIYYGVQATRRAVNNANHAASEWRYYLIGW